MTSPDTEALEAKLREAMEGVTPGPWQVISEEHPWSLPAKPEWGRPNEQHGHHTERRIYTVQHHPQLKGPYPVIELGIGITTEPGKSVHMVSISAENAAYIALCSPDNVTALLDALASQAATIAEQAKEIEDFRSCLATASGKLMVAESRVSALSAEVERLRLPGGTIMQVAGEDCADVIISFATSEEARRAFDAIEYAMSREPAALGERQ